MGLEAVKGRLAHDELDRAAAVLDVVVQYGKHRCREGTIWSGFREHR